MLVLCLVQLQIVWPDVLDHSIIKDKEEQERVSFTSERIS